MKPLSILIVEDHPLQHIYLQNLLSELGDFLLETAEDGKEALERLRQRQQMLKADFQAKQQHMREELAQREQALREEMKKRKPLKQG